MREKSDILDGFTNDISKSRNREGLLFQKRWKRGETNVSYQGGTFEWGEGEKGGGGVEIFKGGLTPWRTP